MLPHYIITMGLDQYLRAEISLPDYDRLCDERKTPRNQELSKLRETALNVLGPKPTDEVVFGTFGVPASVSIRLNVAYWRKSNQIHAWFDRLSMANHEKHLENCEDLGVQLDDLKQLVSTCQEVLDDHDKAGELLPTEGGFFYGSTEYNDCYFNNLKQTVRMLQPFIDIADDRWVFSYHGWW